MEYIVTRSGNQIHKKSELVNKNTVIIAGNSRIEQDVKILGSLSYKVSINIGKFCYLAESCVIEAGAGAAQGQSKGQSVDKTTGQASGQNSSLASTLRPPVRIGNYVFVSPHTHITSISIGNRVLIGQNCKIEGIVGDCCIISDDVHILPNMVIPNFTHVVKSKTRPGLELYDLNCSYKSIIEMDVKKLFIVGTTR